MSALVARQTHFKNPILDKNLKDCLCQVYDLSIDPHEMNNIVCQDWLNGKACKFLEQCLQSYIIKANYDVLYLKFPSKIDKITPDKITFCSVQLHHRIRDKIHKAKCRNERSMCSNKRIYKRSSEIYR